MVSVLLLQCLWSLATTRSFRCAQCHKLIRRLTMWHTSGGRQVSYWTKCVHLARNPWDMKTVMKTVKQLQMQHPLSEIPLIATILQLILHSSPSMTQSLTPIACLKTAIPFWYTRKAMIATVRKCNKRWIYRLHFPPKRWLPLETICLVILPVLCNNTWAQTSKIVLQATPRLYYVLCTRLFVIRGETYTVHRADLLQPSTGIFQKGRKRMFTFNWMSSSEVYLQNWFENWTKCEFKHLRYYLREIFIHIKKQDGTYLTTQIIMNYLLAIQRAFRQHWN